MVSRQRMGDSDVQETQVVSGDPQTAAVNEPAALTAQLVQVIDELCDMLEDQPRKDAVIVPLWGATSHDPLDLIWPGDPELPLVTRWERALRRLERTPACTVAVVDAHCYGAVLEVLLCTDYRIAVASARFHLTTASGGNWPGMGLYRLANQVGTAQARRLTFFRSELTATEALAVGLVDQVVTDRSSALAAVPAVAPTLLGRDIAIRRQLLDDAAAVSYEEALGTHLAACDRELRRAEVRPTADETTSAVT